MVTDFVKPGDKIDINFLHQNNGKTYKSSVFDLIDDHTVEISMPTDEGKIVMFSRGFECQMYFYTSRGLYTCEAAVLDRYKTGNFVLLSMRLTTALKKFQRRDYYRVQCSVDFAYYKISDTVAKLETTEDLFEEITNPDYIEKKSLGRTRDLSGGGIRFTATEPLEIGSKILIVIRLANDKMDHMFYLVLEIISCLSIENVQDRWEVRGKWVFKNAKDRDLIVRWVFEEDRMIRKKENG